jgi:uncharacterized protein (TIGR03663 family)
MTAPDTSRRLDAGLLLLVLLVALGLRCVNLAARPMHADEANQAVKLGQLLETGFYAFDPKDHHGPTLYYFGLMPAWLRGQSSLTALDETTVRLTPALAGVLAVALLWLVVKPWGRWPALLSAGLLAVSPAAVYYSRFFIQETLLVTFTLGALVCGQRWWRSGGLRWAGAAGGCLGLMLATKASGLVYAGVALVALVAAGRSARPAKQLGAAGGIAALVALVVLGLFYSSFGRNPAGLREAVHSVDFMWVRATAGVSGHEKPWWYYGSLFVWQRNGGYIWDQSLFLLPALVGGVVALRRRGLPRFLAAYAALVALTFAAAPYKTPWLVVGIIPGLCALAALALAQLRRPLALPLAFFMVMSLIWQMRQAVFLRPADERNPLAYVHTSPDMKKVPDLATAAPAGPIKVISPEYWPLPWYLRHRPETGYWTTPPADCDGALVFADAEQADIVRGRLKGKYREGFLGLRPGFVLVVFVRED